MWSYAIKLENRVDKQRGRGGTVVGGGVERVGRRKFAHRWVLRAVLYAYTVQCMAQSGIRYQTPRYHNPNPQDHHGVGGDSRAISRTIHFCATEKGR
jgi:hypothetical protein